MHSRVFSRIVRKMRTSWETTSNSGGNISMSGFYDYLQGVDHPRRDGFHVW